MLQLFFLSVAATALGIFLGYIVLKVAAEVIVSQLLFPLEVSLNVRLVTLVVLVGVLGTLLFSLPLVRHILRISPASLIRGFQASPDSNIPKNRAVIISLLYFLPWCIFFALLCIVIARSYLLGGVFFGIFIGLPLICLPLCVLLLKRLTILVRNFPLVPRLALLYSGRNTFATSATFISMTFLVMLLNIVPMIGEGLLQELRYPDKQKLPSLFLFDIQPEQTEQISTFVQEQASKLRSLSPMIRGRLISINEVPFERLNAQSALTREEEQEVRFRNRGLNLTYRGQLDESESIVEGEFFTGRFDPNVDTIGVASIEQRFAERLGIELGDILQIEVFAMPIQVKITSVRRVRWTSFSPNFFLVLQPGIIDDAPATFLAATTHLEPESRASFQAKLLDAFPTISVIDLNRLIERLLTIGAQIRQALLVMIVLTIAAGSLVLYSICAHQMQMKRKDVALLKTLGLQFSTLRNVFRFEILFMSVSAILVGSLLGILTSRVVGSVFFDTVWILHPEISFGVGVLIMGITFFVAELAMRSVLRVPARDILQEE
jgi:putative ABC transport system permease protein